MVYAKIGDYVVYKRGYSPRDHRSVWIRRVAECNIRRWYDRPSGSGLPYGPSAVLSVLPPHIAMQYKLKGL